MAHYADVIDEPDPDEPTRIVEGQGDTGVVYPWDLTPANFLADDRHCIECGALLETDDLFCFSCGGSE